MKIAPWKIVGRGAAAHQPSPPPPASQNVVDSESNLSDFHSSVESNEVLEKILESSQQQKYATGVRVSDLTCYSTVTFKISFTKCHHCMGYSNTTVYGEN